MRTRLRKELENQHSLVDPACWEMPSFILAMGGDGGSGGGGTDTSGDTEAGPGGQPGSEGGNPSGLSGDVGGGNDYGGPGDYGGNDYGNNPPPAPTPAPAPAPAPEPSPLKPFLDALAQYNPQFMNAGFTGLDQGTLNTTNLANTNISNQLAGIQPGGLNQAQQQTANIAQTLQGVGQGAADPRFEAYRQSQLGLLETQKQGELGRASESLSRRGLGGSSAELNAGTSINNQYNQQQQSLSSQLGLQSLGRQDNALQNALSAYSQSGQLGLAGGQFQSGILGQQAGLNQQNFGNTLQQVQSANAARGSNLEALTAGLQNLTLPYALETAREAANNAGESGDGGKK